MLKICEYCKKEYNTRPRSGKLKAEKQKHCSIVCRREHEKKIFKSAAEKIRLRRLDPDYHKRELIYKKEYHKKNVQKNREYYLANKDHYRLLARERLKRRRENPTVRLKDTFANLIRYHLKEGKQGVKSFDTVGYTLNDLKRHIEKQFIAGMSWDNYGLWHIDHIVPVSAFNINSINDIDFKRAWALSNLRPLWAKDNILKRNKLEKPFQPSFAMAV